MKLVFLAVPVVLLSAWQRGALARTTLRLPCASHPELAERVRRERRHDLLAQGTALECGDEPAFRLFSRHGRELLRRAAHGAWHEALALPTHEKHPYPDLERLRLDGSQPHLRGKRLFVCVIPARERDYRHVLHGLQGAAGRAKGKGFDHVVYLQADLRHAPTASFLKRLRYFRSASSPHPKEPVFFELDEGVRPPRVRRLRS